MVTETELYTRVSRRIGMPIPQVQRVMDAYADEYVRAARESKPQEPATPPAQAAEKPVKTPTRRPPRPRKADAQKPEAPAESPPQE